MGKKVNKKNNANRFSGHKLSSSRRFHGPSCWKFGTVPWTGGIGWCYIL